MIREDTVAAWCGLWLRHRILLVDVSSHILRHLGFDRRLQHLHGPRLQDLFQSCGREVAAEKMSAKDRNLYGAALMSGEEDEWFRGLKRGYVKGSESFARSLTLQEGRHRLRRGKPMVRE